jgi:hypothetical protein
MRPGRAAPRALAVCLFLTAALAAPALAIAGAPDASPAGPHDILVMLRMPPDHARPNAVYGGDYGDPATRGARRREARAIAERHGLQLIQGGWPMPLVAMDCFVMRAPEARSVEAAAADLAREPVVAWSQPVHVYQARGSRVRPPLGRPAGS